METNIRCTKCDRVVLQFRDGQLYCDSDPKVGCEVCRGAFTKAKVEQRAEQMLKEKEMIDIFKGE